jgi:hypothetical protein
MFLSSAAFTAMMLSFVAMLLTSAVIVFCSVTVLLPLAAVVRIVGRRWVAAWLNTRVSLDATS